MDRTIFNNLISYTLKADRTNKPVIEIFQTLHLLKEKVKDQILNLKPDIDSYKFHALLDSFLHELRKLDYAEKPNFNKIEVILKKYKTTKESFLLWHTESPNANHWHSEQPPNNMLYEILCSELELMRNFNHPDQDYFPELNNLSYSTLQTIQFNCESVIKCIIIHELILFIESQIPTELKILKPKNVEEKKWFPVAVMFATGEMNKLISQFERNASAIAKDKFKEHFKSYRPYISESINDNKISDKNIFSDKFKLKAAIDYCNKNSLELSADFLEKIKPILSN